MSKKWVTVMGSFVADLAFRTDRVPAWGETLMGPSFQLGPAAKAPTRPSPRRAQAARSASSPSSGRMPLARWRATCTRRRGSIPSSLFKTQSATGAAAIIIDAVKGENAIIVVPGACFEVTEAEVDSARALIAGSSVFVAQLELSLPVVEHGLALAHLARCGDDPQSRTPPHHCRRVSISNVDYITAQ